MDANLNNGISLEGDIPTIGGFSVLQSLKIEDGDVLTFRPSVQMSPDDKFKLAESLKKAIKKDVLIIVLNNDEDLKHLPEVEMLKHGWQKCESGPPTTGKRTRILDLT